MASAQPLSLEKLAPDPIASCGACGVALDSDSNFCTHCGAQRGESIPASISPRSNQTVDERAADSDWNELRRLIGFYMLILGSSLGAGLTGHFITGPGIDLIFSGAFSVVVVIYAGIYWSTVVSTFRPSPTSARFIIILIATAGGTYFFLQGYFWLFEYFDWPILQITESYTEAGWPLISILLAISVQPGIFEEIAFRGVIQTRLAKLLSNSEALLIQAALFSIMHLAPTIFVSHFIMGLLLGWVRLRTGHLYYGMLLHMMWNAFVVMEELAGSSL